MTAPPRADALPGVNFIYHSIRHGGGMERYALDVLGELQRRGIPLHLVTRKLDWDGLDAGTTVSVVPHVKLLGRLGNLALDALSCSRRRPGWPTLGISRGWGCADIAISGGTHIAHLRQKGRTRRGLHDRLTIAIERRHYQGARFVVAHSERVRGEIIADYEIAPDKVLTLPPPVDTARFNLAARSRRDSIRAGLGLRPEDFLLLFPSNNHALKGLDLIVEAIRPFPDVRLVVAGKKQKTPAGVIDVGDLRDIEAYYGAADAVVLASRYEAFGMVAPEAVLCGTPALIADTVGANAVLREPGAYGFERSAEALSAVLARVRELHRQGRLAVRDPAACIAYDYTLQGHVTALLELARQVDGSGRQHR